MTNQKLEGTGKVRHPALDRVWVMNLYPDGQCTGQLCHTIEHALNHSTYHGDVPDAVQVSVRICTVKEWDEILESINHSKQALGVLDRLIKWMELMEIEELKESRKHQGMAMAFHSSALEGGFARDHMKQDKPTIVK